MPGGGGVSSTMLPDGLDRLVGQRLALVAAQIHLDVGGLAVVALRAGRGQRVAPEVRDVLDVCGVGLELLDRARRRSGAPRRRAAGRPPGRSSRCCRSRTPGKCTDALHRDDGGRVLGAHRHRALLPDDSPAGGTATLMTTVSAIQPMMIGIARCRIHRGRPSCRRCPTGSMTSVGVSSVGVVMRSSPGRRSAH